MLVLIQNCAGQARSFSLGTEPCEPSPKAESSRGSDGIHMGRLDVIQRMHLRQKLSIRQIALTRVPWIEAIARHGFETNG